MTTFYLAFDNWIECVYNMVQCRRLKRPKKGHTTSLFGPHVLLQTQLLLLTVPTEQRCHTFPQMSSLSLRLERSRSAEGKTHWFKHKVWLYVGLVSQPVWVALETRDSTRLLLDFCEGEQHYINTKDSLFILHLYLYIFQGEPENFQRLMDLHFSVCSCFCRKLFYVKSQYSMYEVEVIITKNTYSYCIQWPYIKLHDQIRYNVGSFVLTSLCLITLMLNDHLLPIK